MARPGTFQKGNKVGVGNKNAASRPRIVTEVIVAKLNEVSKTTHRANVWDLVDELFEQAMAKEVVSRDAKGKVIKKDGKPVKVRVLGDLAAKKEIIDRAEGKAVQGHNLDTGGGKVTFVFEPGEEDL